METEGRDPVSEGGVSPRISDKASASTGSAGGLPGLCYDHFSAHDLAPHKVEAEVMYEQYLSEKVRHIPCNIFYPFSANIGLLLVTHFFLVFPIILITIYVAI